MDYFLEFHWWYLLVAFLLVLVFGKGKGGVVAKSFTANLEILDERFKHCRPEARYAIFKNGSPDHIEIELDDLFLEAGELLDFYIDGNRLAQVAVKRNKEAEFDHWGDEGVEFPKIAGGEELVIRYKGAAVLKGTFQ